MRCAYLHRHRSHRGAALFSSSHHARVVSAFFNFMLCWISALGWLSSVCAHSFNIFWLPVSTKVSSLGIYLFAFLSCLSSSWLHFLRGFIFPSTSGRQLLPAFLASPASLLPSKHPLLTLRVVLSWEIFSAICPLILPNGCHEPALKVACVDVLLNTILFAFVCVSETQAHYVA